MKALTIAASIVVALLMHIPRVHAQFDPSTTDLWDDSNGNQVTANSALLSSDARDMFGFVNAGSVEPGGVIFQDGHPTGFVHYIEWMTPTENTVSSIVLNIAHDGPPRDANFRGISEFLLYAKNADTGEFDQLVVQYTPSNPYGDSEPPSNGGVQTNELNNLLSLCVNFSPTAAQEFRAEFVQYGSSLGPRIGELDGYDKERTSCIEGIFRSGFEAGEK
jgi:hypothetical protein